MKIERTKKLSDAVNPEHYRNTEGKQLIEIIRWMPFSLGNAIKYIYRNERKGASVQDLRKALWYLDDYLKYPQYTNKNKNITPEVLKEVFTDPSNWETETCLLLVNLDLAYFKENVFGASPDEHKRLGEQVKAKIEARILHKEKE